LKPEWKDRATPTPPQVVPHDREIEVWGGVEYTCNRVGDLFFNQMELSGHVGRPGDYERFSRLGIKTLRLGLLWEQHAADKAWQDSDQRLGCLRHLGISPVVGLLHHGSGPRHTSLLDPLFPEKLSAYAASVAERYSWINAYTPVNECNTTARFSGMYGVWYPHDMSRWSYLRALCNQVKATVLSMRTIRRVNPDAQLIQTEDLGRISGTESLRSTWELMDLRQWLPYDLLCGMVDRDHPMFAYMRDAGIAERDIRWFEDNACPPDTLGINYYVTSDRYIDHRIDNYPAAGLSAEGPFVDVEAVRVESAGIRGFSPVLQEAWERYRIPMALTEVHLGCSADEQIRWLVEAWNGVKQAQRAGAECKAITAWALLGSYYWNELVTRANGHYESGCFDMRSGTPLSTELAHVVQQLATGQIPSHPALSSPGWWQRDSRVLYKGAEETHEVAVDDQVPQLAAAG
jgi:beta-glucosidase/6-phospho-beta-glucosidase/beta-galactosidase